MVPLVEVELYQGKTSPPEQLTESELIDKMEKHGIGTDASIAVHINNICERNYVQVSVDTMQRVRILDKSQTQFPVAKNYFQSDSS